MPDPTRILIVDDTPANLAILTDVLEPRGYLVSAATNGTDALQLASRVSPDVILLDIMMPGLDGFAVCRHLKSNPATSAIPVLFISARDEASALVDGFNAGAADYISKPFQPEIVLARVEHQIRIHRLNQQLLAANHELQTEIERRKKTEGALEVADSKLSMLSDREAKRWGVDAFIGKSKTISRILNDLKRLQNFSTTNVLITGESGTGKELIARAVHFGSARAKGPFIPLNCVAIPSELAESMLFGHVRGSFTGATIDRKGYFELADGGTLFLDEIGDMPAPLQAKLLRVLEDGCITPIGASQSKKVDVRVVAATNVNLSEKMTAAVFRTDLYYRLAQFTVQLPPLRNRREDIPHLARHFLDLFAREMGLKPPALTQPAIDSLLHYTFPGNVRELKNIIERSLIESGGDPIEPHHLQLGLFPTSDPSFDSPIEETYEEPALPPSATAPSSDSDLEEIPLNLEKAEEVLIRRALAQTNGNIAQAARLLGINRTRIYRKFAETTKEPRP